MRRSITVLPGTYQIVATADVDDDIEEPLFGEANNRKTISFTVAEGQPVDPVAFSIITVAGDVQGTCPEAPTIYELCQGGYSGDEQLATQAELNSPWGVAVGPDGGLYIADRSNGRIRRVEPGEDGIVTGNDDQEIIDKLYQGLSSPIGLAIDPDTDGSLRAIYFTSSARVYRVENPPSGAPVVVAGSALSGEAQEGDGGPATEAKLHGPTGIALGLDGSLYIADTGNHRIRRVTPGADGIVNGGEAEIIDTVAGSGAGGGVSDPDSCGLDTSTDPTCGDGHAATHQDVRLHSPEGVAIGSDGSLYIGDSSSGRIRRVSAGQDNIVTGAEDEIITTVAQDMDFPSGLSFDSYGRLYVASHDYVRRLDLSTDPITIKRLTGAGVGQMGFDQDDPDVPGEVDGDGPRPAEGARIAGPRGVAVAPGPNGFPYVYIADLSNHRIRLIAPSTP